MKPLPPCPDAIATMLAREDDSRVQVVETHASWVFLTPEHAWKFKKLGGDVDQLHRGTAAELALNRMLAPSVYLACLPFYSNGEGLSLVAGRQAQAAGWILKMRRLPSGRALDSLLAGPQGLNPRQVGLVAAALARFHRRTSQVDMSGPAYRHSFVQALRQDFCALRKRRYRLAHDELRRLQERLLRQWRRLSPLLALRARDGCLIDGHGDLRAEHIYLGTPILMIDRLDLSPQLRIVDPWDEAGFLAVDCLRLGHARVASRLLAAYGEYGPPKVPRALLRFYQAVRACTRARLAISHLNEARYRGQRKWKTQAGIWLGISAQCAFGTAGRGLADGTAGLGVSNRAARRPLLRRQPRACRRG